MSILQRIQVSMFFCLLTMGCRSAVQSPRMAFLSEVKAERTNYVRLYEISTETLREHEDKELEIIRNVVRSAREASLSCTNDCPLVKERLNRIEHAAEVVHHGRVAAINDKLNHVYNANTDTILFFDYKTESRRELGWAVMTGQKIKKRIVYAEGAILSDE